MLQSGLTELKLEAELPAEAFEVHTVEAICHSAVTPARRVSLAFFLCFQCANSCPLQMLSPHLQSPLLIFYFNEPKIQVPYCSHTLPFAYRTLNPSSDSCVIIVTPTPLSASEAGADQ